MSRDSIEDFKAAFVCITNSPDGYFKSAEELTRGNLLILLILILILQKYYIII
jgi:hypothetical protein